MSESGDETVTQSQPVEEASEKVFLPSEPLYIAAGDEEEHLIVEILSELGELSADEIKDTLNFLEELELFQEEKTLEEEVDEESPATAECPPTSTDVAYEPTDQPAAPTESPTTPDAPTSPSVDENVDVYQVKRILKE
ncbi:hypothetical protein ACROYT_G026141 [Oculina patagonica]